MSLLPNNASPLEEGLADSTCRISDIPAYPNTVWNPETCPANCLPWLAWALSVDEWDEWDEAWDEQTKRNVIKASIAVHRHKGTLGAVKKALAATGLDVTIKEWFETGGKPYTFRAKVNVHTRGISEVEHQTITRLINQTKNVRSHCDLKLYLSNKSTLPRVAIATRQGTTDVLYPMMVKYIQVDQSQHLALACQTLTYSRLYPRN